jgi:steroid delta-isomerase-like uncharacterized protein
VTLAKLVQDHYDGLNAGDADLAISCFARDVTASFPSGPAKGTAELRPVIDGFLTAFPGMTVTVRKHWAQGNGFVAEVEFKGIQNGPLATPDGDVPPSGRDVAFTLIDVFVGDSNGITEHRVYWDNASFLAQLGLLPSAS